MFVSSEIDDDQNTTIKNKLLISIVNPKLFLCKMLLEKKSQDVEIKNPNEEFHAQKGN